MSLYDLLLRALTQERLGSTHPSRAALAEYLTSLQTEVRRLRRGYRRDVPNLYYGGLVCDAYVLTYYPAHLRMFYEVLFHVGHALSPDHTGTIRTTLLGAGPAPEAAALNAFVTKRLPRIRTLELQIYDKNSNGWRDLRGALKREVTQRLGSCAIDQYSDAADLLARPWPPQVREYLPRTHLLVAQNLLNELAEDRWRSFVGNMRFMVEDLPPGAVVVVADQDHSTSVSRLRRVEEELKRSMEVLRSPSAGSVNATLQGRGWTLPPVMQLLFDGSDGLIPKNSVRFNYVVARSRAT